VAGHQGQYTVSSEERAIWKSPCDVVLSQEANRKPGFGIGGSPIAEVTRRRCALPPQGTGESNCHLGAQERVGRTEAPVEIPVESTTGRALLHRLCEVRFSRDTGEDDSAALLAGGEGGSTIEIGKMGNRGKMMCVADHKSWRSRRSAR